jgi:lysyl-tRNA synthetase class 2
MSSLETIRAVRLKKLEALRVRGISPFPISTHPDATLAETREKFSAFAKRKTLTLAGRIMAIRAQGGLVFADINDGTDTFQILLKEGDTSSEQFSLWNETVDISDMVEVCGTLFNTKAGEPTLLVSSWRMLAKALRPMPEKREGLKDTEERFRKRYLDLLSNAESKKRFLLRSALVTELRRVLTDAEFVEVETSMLQPIPGGANAEPFKTHHAALDIDLYLRIAPELDLKKLLIGGLPKVFEMGRSFRNEGIDVTHNPEFTSVEWYEAWSDAGRQRAFVEKILKGVVTAVCGKLCISHAGSEIDFGKPFTTASYFELIERHALIPHPAGATRDTLLLAGKQLGAGVEKNHTREKLLDAIFKKAVRPKLIQPTFVIEYPKDMLPLAKEKENAPELVDAFQFYAGGVELVKAFSEQNDPLEQRARFEEQERRRKAGDKEAEPTDESFLEALEYGMPPAGGVGIGIERLAMLLTDAHNIREVILFPTLRPRI